MMLTAPSAPSRLWTSLGIVGEVAGRHLQLSGDVLVLTHLGRKYWKNEEVVKLARRYFESKRLVIAEDGLEVRF